MADTEEPQFNTLAERIAALNKQKSFTGAPSQSPGPVRKRPPPPPPPGRPVIESRSQTVPVVSTTSTLSQSNPAIPPRPARKASTPQLTAQNGQHDVQQRAPPPLPSRTPSMQSAPSLPPRRPSTQSTLTVRRNSGSSERSQNSAISSLSTGRPPSSVTSVNSDGAGYKLPPAYDPASLPKLPPSRREKEAAVREAGRPNRAPPSPQPPRAIEPAPPARPSLPPRLPSRPAKPQADTTPEPQTAPQPRKLPPRTQVNSKTKTPVILGFYNKDKPKNSQPALPTRPPIPGRPQSGDEPPPVPLSSRPSVAQIEAFETRALTPSTPVYGCLICRDWSDPDAVAAQYPRDSVPRDDPVGYLAQVLCGPFPSYTDKARAIFTWFHHNISYDTAAFFGNNVRHMTAEDTIFTGRAVCAGYAETYKAIANRAGLECVVVTGHGKGFGYTPLKKGERPPRADPTGHAWNAVRIDGGDWKLLDACWGAGHVNGQNYEPKFSPLQFTNANENFGLRHFPSESRYQFRADGLPVTWENYYTGGIDGEPHGMCSTTAEEGIAESSVEPRQRHIPIDSGEVVRFQYSKVCEHWSERMCGGKERLVLLCLPRGDGQKEEMIPMETSGYWYWLDVNASDLGPRGKSVRLLVLTKFGDREDARGVTGKEFLAKFGRCAMGWSYLVTWDLV
ncbi:disulfide-isomerase precursor [Fusarium mexicanum]|uniref:Disulfide-isomerase n=1 Tax=Fusarium mexicanum TaxID=751941 RepID=A0A8H5J7Y0_9HYPO|nr:disulfide-isomerase precursor [Fusarium mexicanum]